MGIILVLDDQFSERTYSQVSGRLFRCDVGSRGYILIDEEYAYRIKQGATFFSDWVTSCDSEGNTYDYAS